MRPIEISRKEVWNNVVRFKQAVAGREDALQHVLLNTHTGSFEFGDKRSADWKQVQLHLAQEQNRLRIELLNEQEQAYEPLAWHVAQETLQVLNQMIAQHTFVLGRVQETVRSALQDLSAVRMVETKGWLEDFPGWCGEVSRLQAEQMLQHSPKGTYLLRAPEEDTRAIVFHLSEENEMTVTAYVCTVVEGENKISDILILHSGQGWTLYNDNPNLTEYTYSPSPQGLLSQVKHRARHPLS